MGSHMLLEVVVMVSALGAGRASPPVAQDKPGSTVAAEKQGTTTVERPFEDKFDLAKCTQLTVGKNPYYIPLEPGQQIVIASNTEQVFITVLDATEVVNGIETRVIEEKEFQNGELKEISRNWFTICKEHGDVFYHGEAVDNYEGGKVVSHGGSWRAGDKGAVAGLMMPGKPEVGRRHYQEVAKGIAEDRAEIISNTALVESPAGPNGEFTDCLYVEETTPLESGKSPKWYAKDVGLVRDGDLVIVEYGSGRSSPTGPKKIDAPLPGPMSEVEVTGTDVPAPVSEALKKLHPTGQVREIKKETHGDGKVLYACEVIVDGAQWDVELAPDGSVLNNQKE